MKIINFLTILSLLGASHFIKAQDWPSYSGPTNNFIADTADNENICTHVNYITPKWGITDTFGLGQGRSQAARYGCSNLNKTPSTHCASPIVYDGKMYLYYLEPVGPHYDQSVVDKLINDSECDSAEVYERLDLWYIEAKDNILCLDAETGEKLWRTSFDGLYSPSWDKPRGSNNTCCAANGKIYHYTSMGKVFCLDANTGDVEWETPNWSSKKNERDQAINDSVFTSGGGYSADALKGSPMIYAGGALIFAISGKIYAYDATDGTKLWEQWNAISKQATPSVWIHESDTFVVSANSDGDLYCFEPKTGTIQWEKHGLGNNRKGLTIKDDYLMCLADTGLEAHKYGHDSKLGVYSLTPDNAELLWICDSVLTSGANPPGVIVNDRAYRLMRNAYEIYEFDIQTGEVLNKAGASTRGGYMCYINGKIIYDVDSHHSDNSFSIYEANADTIYKLYNWTPSQNIDYTNAYEWSMAIPLVNGNMYVRSKRGIHCFDWTKKETKFDDLKINTNDIGLTLLANEKHTFSALGYDDYAVKLNPQPAMNWSALDAGTIDNNTGEYTAASDAGTYRIAVSATQDGNTFHDTVDVNVKKTQNISCQDIDKVYKDHEKFVLQCETSSNLPLEYEKISGSFFLSNDTIEVLGITNNLNRIIVTQKGNENYTAAEELIEFAITNDPTDVVEQEPTSVFAKEIKNNKLKIYPNPTKGITTLSIPDQYFNNNKSGIINVYNSFGEVIFKKKINQNSGGKIQLNLKNFPNNIYFIQIGKYRMKILKKNE